MPFFQVVCFCWKKMFVSEAHGVVRVRLLPWPSCLPDKKNHGLQAFQDGLQGGTRTFQKHGFVTDSDPHGSKSGSEGIPWQLFSRRVSWEEPNPSQTQEMGRKSWDFRKNSGNFMKIGGIPENHPKSPGIV